MAGKRTKGDAPAARIDRERLLEKLESGDIAPLYFFHGEEDYLVEEAVESIISKIIPDKSLYATNLQRETATKAAMIAPVLDSARQMGFFGSRKVIVLSFQESIGEEAQNDILEYAAQPVDSTVLILVAAKIDQRLRFFKQIQTLAVTVRFDRLNPQQLRLWIVRELKRAKVAIDPAAADAMVERVEPHLRLLKMELDKLAIYVSGQKGDASGSKPATVTLEDVENLAGESKQENIFELTRAVGEKRIDRALEALSRLLRDGHHPLMLLTMISRQYRLILLAKPLLAAGSAAIATRLGINPYFAKEYASQAEIYPYERIEKNIRLAFDADNSLKSGAASDKLVLEKLIFDLAG